MKNDTLEDMQDAQEIKRQKQEQKITHETMSKWESGHGLVKDKGIKLDVSDKI